MSAIADRSEITNPVAFWAIVAATALVVFLYRTAAKRLRAADDNLTDRIEAVLADPTNLCQVIVPTPCADVWTVQHHGWRMCAHHAAPFHAHQAERDQLLDLEAQWEADGHHGITYVEAAANGLVDL